MNSKKGLDNKRSRGTLKRILKYINQYRWNVTLSLLLISITVALTLYVPILTGRIADHIVSAGRVGFVGLRGILMRILGAVAVTAVSQWLMDHISDIITCRVVKGIRTRAFNHLEVMPLNYIGVYPSDGIISRIIVGIDQFSEDLLIGFTQLFTGVLAIVGTLLSTLSIQPVITAAVVVLTPTSLFITSFIAKRTFVMFREQSETRGELTSLTDEMLGNMKVVQTFGYQERVHKRFEGINTRLARYSLRATFFSSITSPAIRFINSLVYAAVGIAGARRAIRRFITVEQLTSLLSYASQCTKPFNKVSGVVTELQNALASATRVFELTDEKIIIGDREDTKVLRDAKNNVELKQVCFSYTPEKKLIGDFNLPARPGQRVAIVRPTGRDKTTIVNLLMCLYDVGSEAVKVEETDMQDATGESLRTSYGMVLQGIWLKSGTIRDNISYGHPEASEVEIIRATRQAHAHGFIMRISDRYDTVISEDGGSPSRGQKQLLCIARVMLYLLPILMLDEATSSIDTKAEIKVQKAFTQTMEGRTSFIVVHRLSAIREADVILVMRDGKIVEKGKHGELLGMSDFYVDIYNAQFVRG